MDAAEPPPDPAQQRFIDLATNLLLESIERAAAAGQHGTSQVQITFHAGEIRQVTETFSQTFR